MADAHQTLVKRPAAVGGDDRLVGKENPPFVERGDDLVGGAHIFPAQRFALDIGPVGQERAAALVLRGVEALLGAGQHFGDAAGMARRCDAADRHRYRDRPGVGRHHLVAHAGEQPLGGDRHVVGRAVAQHQAELVAGKTAERVLAAHPAAHALGDRADHLVGDVETVDSSIRARLSIATSRNPHEERKRMRLVDRLFEHFGQMLPGSTRR